MDMDIGLDMALEMGSETLGHPFLPGASGRAATAVEGFVDLPQHPSSPKDLMSPGPCLETELPCCILQVRSLAVCSTLVNEPVQLLV